MKKNKVKIEYKIALLQAGMTQHRLAQLLEVSDAYVSMLLSGERQNKKFNTLSLYAFRMFNPENSGTTFESKVNIGSDVTYTLHSSQYNEGYFDSDTY